MERVRTLIEPLLAARRVELVELTYRWEGPRTVLRFLVDTAAGITVQELSSLNQAIGALLDEHEVMGERYLLEVCSPGLDRPLKTIRDFERVIGRRVWMELAQPVAGRREIIGRLIGVGEDLITLELDTGEKVRITRGGIVRSRQEISF